MATECSWTDAATLSARVDRQQQLRIENLTPLWGLSHSRNLNATEVLLIEAVLHTLVLAIDSSGMR